MSSISSCFMKSQYIQPSVITFSNSGKVPTPLICICFSREHISNLSIYRSQRENIDCNWTPTFRSSTVFHIRGEICEKFNVSSLQRNAILWWRYIQRYILYSRDIIDVPPEKNPIITYKIICNFIRDKNVRYNI